MPTDGDQHVPTGAGQPAGGNRLATTADVARLDFEKMGGLVPQVAQDAHTGEVLMLGYASEEAAQRTVATGELWFWSRQRSRLWKKGETSGNVLTLVGLYTDCDSDALLALVLPNGPTCHTGAWSCFQARPTVAELAHVIAERALTPAAGSYTSKLLQDQNLRLKKLGEEAVELVLACTGGDVERTASEAADLLYHALVACQAAGVQATDVLGALAQRLPPR